MIDYSTWSDNKVMRSLVDLCHFAPLQKKRMKELSEYRELQRRGIFK